MKYKYAIYIKNIYKCFKPRNAGSDVLGYALYFYFGVSVNSKRILFYIEYFLKSK